MVQRIIFNTQGVRVSRKDHDAQTASDENLLLFSGMSPLIPVYSGEAVFTGNGTRTFSFSNTRPDDVITILLRGSDGRMPHPVSTFYATTRRPFTSLTIHNVDGRARTITFKALS
jgi:hypothetical protein